MAEPSDKGERKDPAEKMIALNVKLTPGGDSELPVWANYSTISVAQGIAYLDFGFIEPSTLVTVARAARDGQGSAKGVEGKQVVRVALPLDALERLEQQLQRVGQELRGLRAPKS